jgi:hypothetical protein
MSKSMISMAIFNSYVTNYQRVSIKHGDFPSFFVCFEAKNTQSELRPDTPGSSDVSAPSAGRDGQGWPGLDGLGFSG